MTSPPPNRFESSQSAEDAEIINFALVRNWLSFGVRTLRRRKWFVLLTSALFLVLAFVAVSILPPRYSVECQLLAQRNQVLVTRSDIPGNDPASSAHETILRTENLFALAKQTNLLKEWDARRAPVLKLKDKVMSWLGPPPTDSQRLKGVVEYLRSRMAVWSENGKITIQLMWPDGEMAYRLVDAAQRSFLEARHIQEVSTFSESLAILEGHAADLATQVDKALAELEALRNGEAAPEAKGEQAPAGAAPKPAAAAPAARGPSEAEEAAARERARRLAELKVSIDAKQRIVDDLEASRRRRVAELQAHLQEKRANYTEAHPAVAEAKQALQSASHESPQVQRLEKELKELVAEQERLGVLASTEKGASGGSGARRSTSFSGAVSPASRTNPTIALAEALRDDTHDPATRYARAKLEFAIQNHQQVQEKIRATRMDLETAQAAFKYRYVLVIPPERPRGPVWPKKGLILVAALLCGLVIGVFGAIAFELREDIVSERWQIEQLLELPVLGEVTLAEALREPSHG